MSYQPEGRKSVLQQDNVVSLNQEDFEQNQQQAYLNKLKGIFKKIINKKAGKLLRIGLYQLLLNQPEFFLFVSKHLIRSGQYGKAFNLLNSQISKDTFSMENQLETLNHFMHICFRLIQKIVDKRKRKQSSQIYPLTSEGTLKKKNQLSAEQKLPFLFQLQVKNLKEAELKLINTIQNQKDNYNNNNYHSNPNYVPFKKLEVLTENFVMYFLKTMKLIYQYHKQQGNERLALIFLQKGTDFIDLQMNSTFGDIKNHEVYKLCADLYQIKSGIYFALGQFSQSQQIAQLAFKYYRFAGQFILSKTRSDISKTARSSKVEYLYSSISLNLLLQALCFEYQDKIEKMMDSLKASQWINTNILAYDFTEALRTQASEHFKECKAKYGAVLSEKGEVRNILLKGIPNLENKFVDKNELKEKLKQERLNEYLYKKGKCKEMNELLVVIHKQGNSQRPEQQSRSSSQVYEQGITLLVNGLSIDSDAKTKPCQSFSQEKAKEFGSQSFSDTVSGGSPLNSVIHQNSMTQTSNRFLNSNRESRIQSGRTSKPSSILSHSNHSKVAQNSIYLPNNYLISTPISGSQSVNNSYVHNQEQESISLSRNPVLFKSVRQDSKVEQQLQEESDNKASKKEQRQSVSSNGKARCKSASIQRASMSSTFKSDNQNNKKINGNPKINKYSIKIPNIEDEKYTPKVLTTNKYFKNELAPKSARGFNELSAYMEQEKRFHYLNLQPIKLQKEKRQGVMSLDFVMENLIKEKIIESDLNILQSQQNSHQTNNKTSSSVKTRQISENYYGQRDDQMMNQIDSILGNQVNQKQIEDKKVGEQIKNLMNSLNISQNDQKTIIDDLWAQFEAEKKSIPIPSKSKMGQQGWTTQKILSELMKSINIIGENVNTYFQRFSEFLQTIKDEDFDKNEFNICLRKLVFRQKMGNGVIPQFFADRQLPLTRTQERKNIDDVISVIQSGGERMVEIMSEHKIIKNLFDDPYPIVAAAPSAKPKQSDQKDEESSEKQTNEEEFQKDLKEQQKLSYKQIPKKIVEKKSNSFTDRGIHSSESNVERIFFGEGDSKNKRNFFQKSQEYLRQMVLSNEMEGEDMQKQIIHKNHEHQIHKKQTNLVFAGFQNQLASSIGTFIQKEKTKKNGTKIGIDVLKLHKQNAGTPLSSSRKTIIRK